jgi:hypothetical protein
MTYSTLYYEFACSFNTSKKEFTCDPIATGKKICKQIKCIKKTIQSTKQNENYNKSIKICLKHKKNTKKTQKIQNIIE